MQTLWSNVLAAHLTYLTIWNRTFVCVSELQRAAVIYFQFD